MARDYKALLGCVQKCWEQTNRMAGWSKGKNGWKNKWVIFTDEADDWLTDLGKAQPELRGGAGWRGWAGPESLSDRWRRERGEQETDRRTKTNCSPYNSYYLFHDFFFCEDPGKGY